VLRERAAPSYAETAGSRQLARRASVAPPESRKPIRQLIPPADYQFHPASAEHVAILAGIALVTVAVVCAARRLPPPTRRARIEIPLGAGGVILWVYQQTTWLLPAHFDINESLPLHICAIVALLAPLALLVRRRALDALAYFWGLALSFQALLTPILQEGPASLSYWLFWIRHAAIVVAAVYLVAVLGYRPTWRDWRLAIWSGLAYVAIVLPVDLALGVNYGYIGDTVPTERTVLDFLARGRGASRSWSSSAPR